MYYNPDLSSFSLFTVQVAQLFLLLVTEPHCWSKNAKTATVFLICFDTTTFLQNLEVKWRLYQIFPAKMTLVCASSILFYENLVIVLALVLELRPLITKVYGHFVLWTKSHLDSHLFKEQISGSERNNFLYSERNDHGTKRPDTITKRGLDFTLLIRIYEYSVLLSVFPSSEKGRQYANKWTGILKSKKIKKNKTFQKLK